jgi:hypothetical protein
MDEQDVGWRNGWWWWGLLAEIGQMRMWRLIV